MNYNEPIINFFVVGAQKSGTTTLHNLLLKHPTITLPQIKETKFFANDTFYERGIEFYHENHFPMFNGDSLYGEVDPEYMYLPYVAERLAFYAPSAKIIFLLRNPVSRAFSHYLMSLRRGFEKHSFMEALEKESIRLSNNSGSYENWLFRQVHFSYKSRGYYAEQIYHFLKFFPENQCRAWLFEDLRDTPETCLMEIFDFLGVDNLKINGVSARYNPSKSPKSILLSRLLHSPLPGKKAIKKILPENGFLATTVRLVREKNFREAETKVIPVDAKSFLLNTYKQDLMRLQNYLNRDLSHWFDKE